MEIDVQKNHRAAAGRDMADLYVREKKKAFRLCLAKARINIRLLADKPKSAAWAVDGDYFSSKEEFHGIGNWTSSFHTGMALIAWDKTEHSYFLKQVWRLAPNYQEMVFANSTGAYHALGFLYSLYSVALFKVTGFGSDRDTGIRAAEVLTQRFHKKGNFIRAWGCMNTNEHDNLAIIESMMDLPLLFWASERSGDNRFRDIAVRHANTCLKYFIRPDDSVCHAFRFDLKTGAPLGPDNCAGFSKSSFWARGAAWAIYGFALGHRYTGDAKYLAAAVRVARKFIAQLDDEIVPLWDFKLPPRAPHIRDSSAAAIAICGFQALARQGAASSQILRAKDALLRRICSDDYLEFDKNCCGVLRNAQVGGNGSGSACNAFASWGDYFLMEALDRELGGMRSFW